MPAWTLPTGPGNVTRYPIPDSAITALLPAGVTEGPPAEVAHHARVHGRDDARQGELLAAHDGGQEGDQRRVPQYRDQVIQRIVIDLLDSAHMCIPVLCRNAHMSRIKKI